MFVLNGNSQEITGLFKPFGLSDYEARVYFTLQVCGQTKMSKLWTKAGVPQAKIYQIIPVLAVKGLVEIIPKFPKEVRAKPFMRFANDFLTQRKCLLEEIDRKIREHKGVLAKSDKLIQILGR